MIEKVIDIVEIAEDRRSDIIKPMRCAEIIIQVFDVQRPSKSTFFKGYWHSKLLAPESWYHNGERVLVTDQNLEPTAS